MDIASCADIIHDVMVTTNIETSGHNRKSFLEAIDSNWGEHIIGTEYSESGTKIMASAAKLGMYTSYNELDKYIPENIKLFIIILGSHPSQLCAILGELNEFRHHAISNTFLIGSTTPVYESDDYLNCSALNSEQRDALRQLAQRKLLSSDEDIMTIYFNDQRLNPIFPTINDRFKNGKNPQAEVGASFRNNQLMLTFLKPNFPIKVALSSVIIAAPQPYMPEAEKILKNQMRDATLYRLSTASDFSIFECLKAMRSLLLTDYDLNQ